MKGEGGFKWAYKMWVTQLGTLLFKYIELTIHLNMNEVS